MKTVNLTVIFTAQVPDNTVASDLYLDLELKHVTLMEGTKKVRKAEVFEFETVNGEDVPDETS